MKKKHIERICKNCKLYSPKENHCSVVVLWEGERTHLPVNAQDTCFYEQGYFDPGTKSVESFSRDIQEVKFWVENEDGRKTNKDGVVKMEYPEGFFGEDDE